VRSIDEKNTKTTAGNATFRADAPRKKIIAMVRLGGALCASLPSGFPRGNFFFRARLCNNAALVHIYPVITD
jgi:hypothetical protein